MRGGASALFLKGQGKTFPRLQGQWHRINSYQERQHMLLKNVIILVSSPLLNRSDTSMTKICGRISEV